MGYTHYWTFKNIPKGKTEEVEKLYQQAILDCQRIIRHAKTKLDISLSGYSAHTKPGKYGGVLLNGARSDAHEDFYLRERYKQNLSDPYTSGFNFCKTARKPYDLVVVACLAALKYRLGDYIEVSSDGTFLDWIEGTDLAKTVLKRAVKNPMFDGLKLVG